MTTLAELILAVRDGEPQWELICPGCGVRGDIDADQATGEVSVICDLCGFHDTIEPKPE
jgi:hypothetical protein